ncbi:cobalamin-binding protein [Massilia sp. GCM10020059]|uniref:Cobalamin-binding protein n=1 Tax=Massilia agrisoli TaxID=2892444 RepID=A0ABS8IXB1_9BURK|nr:cobalamin-binding protein [Massilia agrisoli]MCC6072601.1 cobalamin-binding protein [Massilia agrisoli]
MTKTLKIILLAFTACASAANAAVSVVDDAGNRVTLQQPARRIISMSPHVTELLFAAGGGSRIVGAMNFSDYPEAAKRIPLIGSNSQIDMERAVALKPDLLIVWQSGNTARQLEQIRQLGVPVFFSEPRKLDDVATSLTRFGQLLGTEAAARQAAAAYRAQVTALGARHGKRPTVRVFYQIWDKPVYTLSGDHMVSDAIRLCGGENIFASLKVKAPSVSIEAVLQADPEVIVGDEQHGPDDAGITIWKPYKTMTAVARGNLFTLNSELLTRSGPRLPQGVAQLCERLETARQRRPK